MGFIPGIREWFDMLKAIAVPHLISRSIEKNHIISVDAKKSFDKRSTTILYKTLKEIGIHEIFLSMIKRNLPQSKS